MVCVQNFNQENYLSEEAGVWKEAIHNGCFSAVPVSFAGFYLHRSDIMAFFSAMGDGTAGEDTGQQEPAAGVRPGLAGFSEILGRHGLEWESEEYDPREFHLAFRRDSFALCGFYPKATNAGHAIAIFVSPYRDSDSVYIFDPNNGLFRGDSHHSLFDHIDYYLVTYYPDIDTRRVSFRNVRRASL